MEDIVTQPTIFAMPASSIFHCSVCKQKKSTDEQYCTFGKPYRFLICLACASVGKHCAHCKKYFLFAGFPKSGGPNRGGVSSYCKSCMLAYKRQYYKKHGKSERTHQRESEHRYNKYGLSTEDYQRMLAEQDGLCAACGQPETQRNKRTGKVLELAIDHNHETGQTRRLLCSACNIALGHLQDSPQRLRMLLAYIEQFAE